MSFLIFAKRHQAIIARKNELNYKLMQLNEKLMDLQKYATAISDGSVSLNDLSQVPSSQFNRMSIFMLTGHQIGLAGMQENLSMMSATGTLNNMMSQVQGQNAQETKAMQSQYLQIIKSNLYKNAKENFTKQETNLLNLEDKKIEQEKAKLETELKLLESEEESVKKGEDQGAKNAAPQYVA